MKQRLHIACVRWTLAGAFLICMYCAGHGALLIYLMNSTGGIADFQPTSAELVSQQAAPFQANTADTDGMFKIVQRQHMELHLMFSRLETAQAMNGSLAWIGTVVFSLLSLCLGTCLVLFQNMPVPVQRTHLEQASPKDI